MFQCLLIAGENHGKEALRDAQKLVITDQQFESFLQRHGTVACLVPESNVKVCNKIKSNVTDTYYETLSRCVTLT